MREFFAPLINLFKGLLKRYLPALHSLIEKSTDYFELSRSWVAMQSRRFGFKTIMVVGLISTAYALFLFFTHKLAPESPKPSHDVILKTRFSSPAPSPNVIILDIDERSLAALSQKHGRWPWSRDVLADGLQKVNDLGARAVLFNVMLSDPDKGNPDADSAMDITAQMVLPVAFPLIRLNPKNDELSRLRISQLKGAKLKEGSIKDPTLAVIIPMFTSMQERLGIANLQPDDDGVVRKYPFVWQEKQFSMASLVGRTAELGKANLGAVPDKISLNWRNKQGRYIRVSFSDLLKSQPLDPKMNVFKDSFVVLGLSAPGLGQTKGTSVVSVEDDNEILATALDDVLHDTYLRTMPDWVALIINLVVIWTLVWLAITNLKPNFLNGIFVLAQSGLGGITLLSASYTHTLIDLSDSMAFGVAVFSAIKIVKSLDDSWSRAKPGMRRFSRRKHTGTLLLIGYLDDKMKKAQAMLLQKSLEAVVGMHKVILVDDMFGGESFIKATCVRFRCQLVMADESQLPEVLLLLEQPPYIGKVTVSQHILENQWDPDDAGFGREVAPLLMVNSAAVLSDA